MKRIGRRQQAETETRSIARTFVVGAGAVGNVYKQPWETTRAIASGQRESLVAAIVSAVAGDVGDTERFPLRIERTGTHEDVTDREQLAFAFNVSASTAMSATTMRMAISMLLDFSGEAYLVEVKGTLTPLIGGLVDVITAAEGSRNRDGSPALVAGYIVKSGQGLEIGRYDADGYPVSGLAEGQLHRIYLPYPGNPYRAAPLIEQAGLPIDVVHYSRLATKALLQNAGQPAGLVQLLDPAIDQESVDSFDRRLNSRLSDVSQKGRTLVVGSDVKYTQLGDSNPGTGWASLAQQAREDVLTVWNMPESRLGRGGARTYENQRVEQAAYLRNTVLARLNQIAAALNQVLRPRGLHCYFDASNVPELHEDNTAEVAQVTSLYQAGIATLNEARQQVGLEPLPDGDQVLENPRILPVGEGEARDAVPFPDLFSPR